MRLRTQAISKLKDGKLLKSGYFYKKPFPLKRIKMSKVVNSEVFPNGDQMVAIPKGDLFSLVLNLLNSSYGESLESRTVTELKGDFSKRGLIFTGLISIGKEISLW